MPCIPRRTREVIAPHSENDYTSSIGFYSRPLFRKGGVYGFMSAKRRPPVMPNKPKDEGNKKALIITGSVLAGIIVVVSILIIVTG